MEEAFAIGHHLLVPSAPRSETQPRVVVLTGAGISAESGVPTFRDALTGLWTKFDPLELATPEAFARDPKLVWDWYAWRRELVSKASPNSGHFLLAQLERELDDFALITQNVDGLHERAGSRRLYELHGNIHRVTCSRERTVVSTWDTSSGTPPRCAQCGAPLRPDVVWFGESLDADLLRTAYDLTERCEVFLSVGTASEVYPAAALPELARDSGAYVVEINPNVTAVSHLAHRTWRETASTGLAKARDALRAGTLRS